MLDVNLGNKTLVVGVLIALILSYGMVNFDSGAAANQNNSVIRTALQPTGMSVDQFDAPSSSAQENLKAEPTGDTSTLNRHERRELDRS